MINNQIHAFNNLIMEIILENMNFLQDSLEYVLQDVFKIVRYLRLVDNKS